jgi:hypothetical protein
METLLGRAFRFSSLWWDLVVIGRESLKFYLFDILIDHVHFLLTLFDLLTVEVFFNLFCFSFVVESVHAEIHSIICYC